MDIKHLRRDYTLRAFDEKDANKNPFMQFTLWFEEALKAEIVEPNAMALATVSKEGTPSSRMVLMKHFGEEGVDFFTNLKSRKSVEVESTPFAAVTFYWKELERQVNIEGRVIPLGREASKAYFDSRPRASRLSAWASKQGEVIVSREELEAAYREVEKLFEDKEIPLPPYWGGYRIIPVAFEFWQGRPNRLHDRLRYSLEEGVWKVVRLSP